MFRRKEEVDRGEEEPPRASSSADRRESISSHVMHSATRLSLCIPNPSLKKWKNHEEQEEEEQREEEEEEQEQGEQEEQEEQEQEQGEESDKRFSHSCPGGGPSFAHSSHPQFRSSVAPGEAATEQRLWALLQKPFPIPRGQGDMAFAEGS